MEILQRGLNIHVKRGVDIRISNVTWHAFSLAGS
jgi:hypothetical protein